MYLEETIVRGPVHACQQSGHERAKRNFLEPILKMLPPRNKTYEKE